MITIRIFKTQKEAEKAKKVLIDDGFVVTIIEDTFNNVPIQKFGVPARFRLNIEDKDFYRVTKFLANKLKSEI